MTPPPVMARTVGIRHEGHYLPFQTFAMTFSGIGTGRSTLGEETFDDATNRHG